MTLSPIVKKVVLSGAAGFGTGILTYLSTFVLVGKLELKAILLGMAVMGITRGAGAILAAIKTKPADPMLTT